MSHSKGGLERRSGSSPERRRHLAEVAFQVHARTYVLVNALLIGIWLVTGAGYFWPVWPIMGWGFAVVCQAMATYAHPRRGEEN